MDKVKQSRMLELFFRGMRGEDLSVRKIADQYGVSTKSVSRDISDLKNFLAEHRDLVGNSELQYSYQDKVYRLHLDEFLNSQELFSLAEIILGARAYSKMELLNLIDKLKRLATPSDRKQLEALIQKEVFYYHEVHHDCDNVQETLWQLIGHIEDHREITICYHKVSREYVERRIWPMAVLFTEYYFYLIAFTAEPRDYVPIYFRVDRISRMVKHRTRFSLPDGVEFNEGLFRAQNQFMFPGKLRTIRFEFSGPSIQAILDRLPTARVIEKSGSVYTVEATIYGRGIKMYLLSQGAWVKVLSPPDFVEEMREEVRKMGLGYQEMESQESQG